MPPPKEMARDGSGREAARTPAQLRILNGARTHADQLQGLARLRGSADTTGVVPICLDVEAYEMDHSKILEVGICWVSDARCGDDDKFVSMHFILREHAGVRNGRYVPDRKYGFVFGTSVHVSMEELRDVLRCVFEGVREKGSTPCLVGHTIESDLVWLSRSGVELRDCSAVDLALVDCARNGTYSNIGLHALLTAYDVPYQHEHLHNGGNDAVYTMALAFAMMDGFDGAART